MLLFLGGCFAHRTVQSGTAAVCAAQDVAAAEVRQPPDAPAPRTLAGARAALNVATFDSAWSIIARTHWDTTYNGVHWAGVRETLRPRAAASRDDVELRDVLTQMLSALGQSHFTVIPRAAALSESADRDLAGGIGASVREARGAVLITAVRPGGPAAMGGMRPGFVVETIDGCRVPQREAREAAAREAAAREAAAREAAAGGAGVPGVRAPRGGAPGGGALGAGAPAAGAPGAEARVRSAALRQLSTVLRQLRGAVGDSVHLVVRNASGKRQHYTLVRDAEPGAVTKLGILPAMSAEVETFVRVTNGKRIGVLRFNSWMPMLMPRISAAIDAFRNADGIVLDLRGNTGGVAPMASGVAGHFVDTVLTLGAMIERGATRPYRINPQRVNARNEPVTPYDGPLALVVDELAASTTEIFAGGLQALGRARVFGARTAGAVLPAMPDRLPNGDVLYHAVANFLSADGRALEGRGVIPDVAIPVTRAALLRGGDPALDAAVHWAATTESSGFVIRK